MSRRAGVTLVWLAAMGALALTLRASVVAQPTPSARQAASADSVRRDRFERAYRASNLGIARLEQFDYAAAAGAFRQALGVEAWLAAAHFNLALALFYDDHADTAEAEVRAADAAMSGAPQPPYLLGLIAKAQNRPDEAIAAFRRVLAIDPQDAGTNVNLAQVYLQQRDTTQAIALFRTAVAAEPFNVTAAYGLATALVRSGRSADGQAAMQRFQTLRDSAYGVTYAQGYLQQGRYAEAIVSTGAEPELVDAATPSVVFKDATPDGFDRLQARDLTLFDANGDGDLDLLVTGASSLRLFRNGAGRFTDATASSGLQGETAVAAVAGDFDNDGRPDLFLLRDAGSRLLHQTAAGAFEDVTAKATLAPSTNGARSAAFVDVDHDGDLDLVVAAVAGPTQLLRNNGNGTFTDIAAAAGFGSAPAGALAIVPTDFDNHRDIDLLIVAGAAAPALFQNRRDGSFRDVAAAVGLPGRGTYSAVAAGDINKDGFTDFFFGRPDGAGVFAMSDGRGRFAERPAPDGSRGAVAAMFIDYDNDGLVDLLVGTPTGPALFRNLGDRWVDVTEAAGLTSLVPPARHVVGIVAGDLDRDGDTDVIVRLDDGSVRVWRNDGGSRQRSVRVRLTARVSNRSTFGSRVEMRAGGLRQQLEPSSATPAVAPADLVFGLGSRTAADIVRVLWPSGILQSEIVPPGSATGPIAVALTELDRKPSSCPFLFTWNGTRFEFVTDFLGGGEMGDWVAPAVWDTPDPDEYVRIRGDQLRPRSGRYDLRVTNELEEAMFLDRVQLVAVDHPADAEVFPNEGLRDPPRPPFRIYATRGAHPPVAATDEHGHDVLPLIRSLDRRYPDDFALSPIRGYAATHTLTLDPGPDADKAVLLLTGWTDYAFSTDNVAAGQSGVTMQPPVVQVKDGSDAWQTTIADMGFPVGRPQTVVVDLRGRFRGPSREVRIVTNMRIYWDQILVDTSGGRIPLRTTRIAPASADLRRRGFSEEVSPDGREPFGYDYARVTPVAPWKTPAGRYTRYGDVLPLVSRTDDMFAIAGPGDELALSFAAASLPALPRGWSRTFFLYADGYSKEMNIRSATPDAVAPLPFHAMRGYPYGPGEHYPDTPAYRRYLARYNTRVVTAPVPSLEHSAATALEAKK
jgi:cytochrome c-type biogenesis protein CcmH/NrfG